MAVFTGAADALTAGVAIQQALDRHNRSGGPARLEVRIEAQRRACHRRGGRLPRDSGYRGGHRGGPTVRLAEGGQILASEIVRALAGSAGGHRFRPVGALALKGLPVPVAACEVAWESLPVAAVPLPALLTDIGRVFVGRDAELGQLGQLWKRATACERPVVAGEPGVGKTRPSGATEPVRAMGIRHNSP